MPIKQLNMFSVRVKFVFSMSAEHLARILKFVFGRAHASVFVFREGNLSVVDMQ